MTNSLRYCRNGMHMEGLHIAQSRITKGSLICADVTRDVLGQPFPALGLFDVLEHIEDDITVFKNFYNSLKQGGYLLVNTPSAFGGSDVHGDEEESFVGEHARTGYSDNDLKTKLASVGFKDFSSFSICCNSSSVMLW